MKIMMLSILLAALSTTYTSAGEIDDVLNRATQENRIVMLELGSVGCIPCEQMKPVMQKLRDSYKGKLDVLFIDVRRDRPSALRFGVTVIPTQVFLDRRGKEFHRHVGFYSYEEIAVMLKKTGI